MASDPLIGTVIDGRFEIRDLLGQGGMGTVYRAWQRSVGREVAIKLIDRSISSDPLATQRFLREAHLASQLSHPNTISILDFGQMPDGRLFTAMELVRGRTLGRELRAHGALGLPRIVRIGTQLCDALEAAHGRRIVHRDLKLDNVMLLDGGNDLIKVLDFGLAKKLDDQSTQATAAGIVVGTLRYIAPEVAMTGAATPASDMYAVGVMLGELALATPLWEGATLSHILPHQLSPEPVIARIPEPLRALVARLLDPTPQRRPTAGETRTLLHQISEGKPLGAPREERGIAPPERAPASRKHALLAAGTVVFIASGFVAYFATRSSAPNTPGWDTDVVDTDVVDTDASRTPRTPAMDPWQAHPPVTPQPASPSLADVAKTPLDAGAQDTVRLTFVGLRPDETLFINRRRKHAVVYDAQVGERVDVEVWNLDHTILIAKTSFSANRDEEIQIRN